MAQEEPIDIVLALPTGGLTNQQILSGPYVSPKDRVSLYSPSEWEEFTREYALSLKPSPYVHVLRISGPRDQGRDVVAYYGTGSDSEWDNYQCKHYKDPLQPNDAYLEIGKACYYTWKKRYSIPKTYFFAAPKDIGPTFSAELLNPDGLRERFLEQWDKWCASEIVKGTTIQLTDDFRQWVLAFPFAIFRQLPLADMIEKHRLTPYHAVRFGNGLVKPRPEPEEPPSVIATKEQRYVEQLLAAYSQNANLAITIQSLANHEEYGKHLIRQRRDFYCAESLQNFSRDIMPTDKVFTDLQDEIHDAVVDACDGNHVDGFTRVNKVLEVARALPVNAHVLFTYIRTRDKAGVCHQLANDNRLKWVK